MSRDKHEMNNVVSCTAYVWDHSAVWAWIYSNKSIFSSGHTLHRLPKIATFWNEEGFLGTGEDGFCSHFWPGCFANRVLKSATLAAAQGDNICSLVLKEETITSHKHCFTLVCCRTWALDACNSTDHKLPSNQVKFHQGGAKESDVRSLSCHGGQAFTFVRQRWR